MEIIKMEQVHVSQIAQLEKQCFSDPWSENSISSEVSNPLSLWLVATEDGLVKGYVGSQSVLDGADMMNLAVAQAERRKGIAEQLVEQLIIQLSQNGVRFLMLEVRKSNDPAISLYKKLGFQVVGRRPGYYHHPREDAWIMRKEW